MGTRQGQCKASRDLAAEAQQHAEPGGACLSACLSVSPTVSLSSFTALQGGRVVDRASDKLAHIRQQRRSNMKSLRKDMTDWARQLASQGISEEALVVIRRDRLCVPVKAGRQVYHSPARAATASSNVIPGHLQTPW